MYANFWKPRNCPQCNYEIGGGYVPKAKVPKRDRPNCVNVSDNLYSVKTSTRGDRGFVVYDEKTRFCHQDRCKRSRAVTVVSANTQLSEYSCEHIKLVEENGQRSGDEYMITIETILAYPCDNNTTKMLESMLPTLEDMPAVIKIDDGTFVVYGMPSSASPLGYTHVYEKEGRYRCSSKNCKTVSGTGRQQKISKLCIHQHVLFCALNLQKPTKKNEDLPHEAASQPSTSVANTSNSTKLSETCEINPSPGRSSTIRLNMDRYLPSSIPPEIFTTCRAMDAATILNFDKVLTKFDIFLFLSRILHIAISSLNIFIGRLA